MAEQAPQRIGLRDPTGKVHLLTPEEAAGLPEGFTPADPTEIAIEEAKAEQVGILGALKAAVESAAGTATFGASTWAETATGLSSPEAIKARQEEHPVSSFLGAMSGVAVPLIGAEALAARGATTAANVAGAAPRAIARIGEGGANLVRGLAKPTSALGKIGLETLARGTGSAIEGAAYGLGHSVSEDALDPNLTVEAAMARGGTDALLGGGLGFVLGAPLGLVSSVLKRGPTGAELANRLEDFAARAQMKAIGATASDLKAVTRGMDGLASRGERIALAREAQELGILGRFESADTLFAKAGVKMGEVAKDMQSLIAKADAATLVNPALKGDLNAVLQTGRDVLARLQKDPFQESAANAFGRFVGRLETDATALNGKASASQLWDMRKAVDTASRGWSRSQDPSATALGEALTDLRRAVSKELDNTMDRSGLGTAAWKTLSRQYRVAASMETIADRVLQREAPSAGLSLTETMAGIAGFLHGGVSGVVAPIAYAAARRMGPDVVAAGARGAADLLRGVSQGTLSATAETAARAAVDAPVAGLLETKEKIGALAALERTARDMVQDSRQAMTDLVTSGPKSSERAPKSSDIMETVRAVNELTNDPARANAVVSSLAAETGDHTPNMSMVTGAVSGRVLQYLQRHAPQPFKPYPMGPEVQPDRSALLGFWDIAEALRDPVTALKASPTPATVEAIAECYPTLLQNFRVGLLHSLADAGPDKIYTQQQRAAISAILGVDVDGSQSPTMIAMSQAAFLASQAPIRQPARKQSVKMKTHAERYAPTGSANLRDP